MSPPKQGQPSYPYHSKFGGERGHSAARMGIGATLFAPEAITSGPPSPGHGMLGGTTGGGMEDKGCPWHQVAPGPPLFTHRGVQ